MLKILLLCGGKGRERDISLNSVRSVYDHIKDLAMVIATVVFIDTDEQKYQIDELYLYSNTSDDFRFLLKSEITPLTEEEYLTYLLKCDLVFPVIHGVGGEDGVLQKKLEEMGIPFIGSPSCACEKMYNKRSADEQILTVRGMVNIPKIYISGNFSNYTSIIEDFVNEIGDVCLKPTEGGSSFGVEFAFNVQETLEKTKKLLEEEKYDTIVIEKRLHGKEFTIIILDNGGIPVALMPTEIEIIDNGAFDRRRKYMSTTEVNYHCPARFENEIITKIRSEAEELFSFIGARDFLRIDGWVLEDGSVYFSDFNPISGMEQNSFIFQQATMIGFTHITLLEYILRNACNREHIIFPENKNTVIQKRRVHVLLGGITSERQVSLLSGTNVWMKLLHSKKYFPIPYILTKGVEVNNWKVAEIPYPFALLHTTEEIINKIEHGIIDIDIVKTIRRQLGLKSKYISFETKWTTLYEFLRMTKECNAYLFIGLHGGFGENGSIQTILDDFCIDYNGSNAATSALCMDKYRTGCKVTELGLFHLRTCKKTLRCFDVKWEELTAIIGVPIIAKPNDDGCSTGVIKLSNEEDLGNYLDYCHNGKFIPQNTFDNQPQIIAMPKQYNAILFEEYIETDSIVVKNGKLVYNNVSGWVEITIGVLEKQGNYHAFNPSVTIAENNILSVEEKFQGGVGINLTPPPEWVVSSVLRNCIKYYAECVAKKCGIKDYCRIDMFINNQTDEVIVIEINTLPGLSPSTVLFQQAAKESPSLSPLALLEKIIEN